MKYLKRFESLLDDILAEGPVTDDIIAFFKKHNIDEITVHLKNNDVHLVYEYYKNDDEEMLLRIIDGHKDDVGVGTPRNEVLQLLKDILDYLTFMNKVDITPEDIQKYNEYIEVKEDANKYNL